MIKLETQHSQHPQNAGNEAVVAGCHPTEVQNISAQVAGAAKSTTDTAIDDGDNDSDYWSNGDACIVIARGELPTPCK